MKNTIIPKIKPIVMMIVFMLLANQDLSAQAQLTGAQIIEKANDTFNPQTSHSKMKMTIVTSSGDLRTFVYESWSKDEGEKNLMRYLEPRRARGQAILMRNNANDIWMYFPRTNRVRKLATHAKKQKMEGSDFSYEDLGSGNEFIADYHAERLEDEEIQGYDCYKLELTKKPDSDISYSRLIMWVIKENYYPIVIDYYDEANAQLLLKRLAQSNIEMIDGIPTARKIVMQNKINNTKTVMEILEIEYDVQLSDQKFTERELRK